MSTQATAVPREGQLGETIEAPTRGTYALRIPIDSAYSTVRLRRRVKNSAGSKTAALAMAYNLLDTAQERWRYFIGHEVVAMVLNGVTFKDGSKFTDDDTNDKRNNGREARRLIKPSKLDPQRLTIPSHRVGSGRGVKGSCSTQFALAEDPAVTLQDLAYPAEFALVLKCARCVRAETIGALGGMHRGGIVIRVSELFPHDGRPNRFCRNTAH